MYIQLKNQKYMHTAIKTNVSESTLKENVKSFDLLLFLFLENYLDCLKIKWDQ